MIKLELSEMATDLDSLEEEQKNLRTLGSKMWNLAGRAGRIDED